MKRSLKRHTVKRSPKKSKARRSRTSKARRRLSGGLELYRDTSGERKRSWTEWYNNSEITLRNALNALLKKSPQFAKYFTSGSVLIRAYQNAETTSGRTVYRTVVVELTTSPVSFKNKKLVVNFKLTWNPGQYSYNVAAEEQNIIRIPQNFVPIDTFESRHAEIVMTFLRTKNVDVNSY